MLPVVVLYNQKEKRKGDKKKWKKLGLKFITAIQDRQDEKSKSYVKKPVDQSIDRKNETEKSKLSEVWFNGNNLKKMKDRILFGTELE